MPIPPERPKVPIPAKPVPVKEPKKNKEDNWTLKLLIRTYSDNSMLCHVWLLRCDGGVSSSMLNGNMFIHTAELLASKLGLPVEREKSPLGFQPPINFPEE